MPSFRRKPAWQTRDTEHVTVTVGDTTRTVEIPGETTHAPADWDRARQTGATAGTGVVVAGALAWSVYAIGSLLSDLAPPALAYAIAAVFDLAWILCMGYEYELRFTPSRQRAPRVLGWVLLAVSVATIFVHGLYVADAVVALAGSVIAVLAKVLWHMRVHVGRRELSPAVQAWVDAELDDAAAVLLVVGARRRAARAQAKAREEVAALGLPAVPAALPSRASVPASRTPGRSVLRAVPDGDTGQDGTGQDEDGLMQLVRDAVGDGPVPSREALQKMLRAAGHGIGTDRAQRIVRTLRDEARDGSRDTGTSGTGI